MASTPLFLGIDLGTSTTRMAQMEPAKRMPTIVRNTLSNEATTSVVYLPRGGTTRKEPRSYGENAAPKAIIRPNETVVDLMPWLLSSTEDSNAARSGHRALLDGTMEAEGAESSLFAPQAVGYFLKCMLSLAAPKKAKEATATESVVKLCATLPATASETARRALLQASLLAGVASENLCVATDDEAAAVYFHHHQYQRLVEEQEAGSHASLVLLVNIGAGSCFATLLSVSPSSVEKLGDTATLAMGSSLIDAQLVEHVLVEVEKKHGVSAALLKGKLKLMRKLYRDCRKAKEILSTSDHATIELESFHNDQDARVVLTRELLERGATSFLEALKPLLLNIRERITGLEESMETTVRVEMIGGGWRCPCVSELLRSVLQVERLGTALDANLAVAEGAALLSLLAMHSDAEAAALEGLPHAVTLNGFPFQSKPPLALSEAEEKAVECWTASEKAETACDEAIQHHLHVLNQLDTLVLQSLSVLESTEKTMSEERREAAKAYLLECDDYLRTDGLSATTEEVEAKEREVAAHLKAEFPEFEAYYEAQRVENERKEEELARLSREKREEEDEPKSDPQRLRVAQRRREQGAQLFKEECWGEAQTRFVQALSVLGQLYDTSSEENKAKKAEISLSCHLNIASCSVRLRMWRNAVNNATSALELSPDHPKAYFRRGQAYRGLKEYAEAITNFEKASLLTNQKDAAVEAELKEARGLLEAEKQREKKMFKKMFA